MILLFLGSNFYIIPDLNAYGVGTLNAAVGNACEPAGQGVDIDMTQGCSCLNKSGHSGFGADVCMWSEIVPDCV